MNEQMVRFRLDALKEAVNKDDEKAVLEIGLSLASQVLLDINRIANALETLAGRR